MKQVSITFDYEGTWGMPHTAPYDLAATTIQLLDVLARHNAHAVFFVTGKLIEQYPAIITSIHEAGHEIGFHGYEHEHMHELSDAEIVTLAGKLQATAKTLKKLVGYAPRGFRAPYLMGPKFYVPTVYRALAGVGFTWVSNREIRWPLELARPDRFPWLAPVLRNRFMHATALIALNPQLLATERPGGGRTYWSALRWLLGERAPYRRAEGLLEYPLYSPLDCDLVDFPLPEANSGPVTVAYAGAVLRDCYDRSGSHFNLNCHDWLTGTRDRLAILDQTLAYIDSDPQARYVLPGFEGGMK